jgi:hypothetical protein
MPVLFTRCCCLHKGSCVGYQTAVQPDALGQNFEKIIDSDPHSAVTNQDPPAVLPSMTCVTLHSWRSATRRVSHQRVQPCGHSLCPARRSVDHLVAWSCLLQGYKVPKVVHETVLVQLVFALLEFMHHPAKRAPCVH